MPEKKYLETSETLKIELKTMLSKEKGMQIV